MPRSSQERDQRRERILAGAIEAFAAKGFHGTRVRDVAKAAGCADGTIYLYFRGKNDLLAQIFSTSLERFWERGRPYLEATGDPAEQLARLLELHLRFLGENRALATVFQVDLRHSTQFLEEVSRKTLRGHLDKMTAIIGRGQQHGRFRAPLPPAQAALMVFGVLDQLVSSWVLSRRNYRLESAIPAARGFVLRALGAEEEEVAPRD